MKKTYEPTKCEPWADIQDDGLTVCCPVCRREMRMVRSRPFTFDHCDEVLAGHNKAKGVRCEGSGLVYGDYPSRHTVTESYNMKQIDNMTLEEAKQAYSNIMNEPMLNKGLAEYLLDRIHILEAEKYYNETGKLYGEPMGVNIMNELRKVTSYWQGKYRGEVLPTVDGWLWSIQEYGGTLNLTFWVESEAKAHEKIVQRLEELNSST